VCILQKYWLGKYMLEWQCCYWKASICSQVSIKVQSFQMKAAKFLVLILFIKKLLDYL